MGLKKGERIERLAILRVLRADRVPLRDMTQRECILEGFSHLSPDEFIVMFCQTHPLCHPGSYVTRIEFEYVDLAPWVEDQTAPIHQQVEEAIRRGIERFQ